MAEDPLIGQVIDERYKILSAIGRGGMAVVYRAEQPAMGRDVAIKVIAPEAAALEGRDFLERFKREAQIVARLEHPHILPVYDFGDYQGQAYLVMRLLDGGDLKDQMSKRPFALDEINTLMGQIASALTYAHEAGIIHRDLKPQNILIDSKRNPYLMDFGIAKSLHATQEMTATGTIMGTPSYMAPEQWRSEAVDARTDIYALGVICYSMMTRKLPFESDTPFSLMYMHLDEMPEPLEARNSTLPTNLTEVVFKAMAKSPQDRFSSAVEFALALDEAIRQPGTTMHSRRAAVEHETFVGTDTHATFAADSGAVPTRMSAASAEKTELTQVGDDMNQPTVTIAAEAKPAVPPVVSELADAAVTLKRRVSPVMAAAIVVGVVIVAVIGFLLMNSSSGDDGEVVTLEDGQALVTATRGILYAEPNTLSEEVSIAPERSELVVTGVTEDQRWYQVEFLGETGWILANQVRFFGDVAEVAVIASPTPTATPVPTDTPTPAPTSAIATAVACVLTAQSGEVNIRSLPSTAASSEVTAQIFGGDQVTAVAQTADGWYLTDLGWVFGSVMSLSSPFVCGALPVMNPVLTAVEVAEAQPSLCDVLTADTALYRDASSAALPLAQIPPSVTLPVFEVASGIGGATWYRTVWENPEGIVFQGWVNAESAGPVAGSCPDPTGGESLFGNPYVNPLALPEEPTFSDGFDTNSGQWDLMIPGAGEFRVEDGLLRFTLGPRQSNSLIVTSSDVGTISDAYISMRLTIPAGLGESYFVEAIVRAFYTVRMSELGGVALAVEANPSQIFGATPDEIAPLDEGFTLGIHLQGDNITIYVNGQNVLEVQDDSRDAGILLRIRMSNRSQENDLTLLVDDFAYWDLSG